MSQFMSWPQGTSAAAESLNDVKVESGPELTMSSFSSPTTRQPSSRVSSSPHTPTHHFVDVDAISALQSPSTTRTARQDVLPLVKPSASSTSATRTYGQSKPSSSSLETSNVSSSSQQTLSHHGLTNTSNRLRTPIFQSSKDLAAHYGIPQFLPPAPRTTPRTSSTSHHHPRPVAQQQPQNQFPDFDQIKNSYLAMLSSKPEEATSTTTADSSASPAGGAPAQPSTMAPPPAPVVDKEIQDLLNIFGENNSTLSLAPSLIMTHYLVFASAESPEFKDTMNQFTPSMDMDSYLTSPLPHLGHDFEASPYETPFNDFLSTPLIDDTTQSAFSSPLFTDGHDFDMDVFGDALMNYSNSAMYAEPAAKVPHPTSAAANMSFDLEGLIPFTSPEQPMEDSFPAPPPPAPTTTNPPAVDASTTEARRRGGATGTRKGITPDSLIPLDAPTQPRKYTTPSATSRKDLPAVFARKRARSQAFGDEADGDDDELARHEASPPGPNATEREQIEWKRRQNTLAARKSRKRKLEHQQRLEEDVKALTRERDCWRTRAGVLQQLLVSHGVPFERWEDEEA